MREIAATLVIGLTVAAAGMFGADNSVGTWKRNIAKSKPSPTTASPITSLTIVNTAIANGIDVKVTGGRKDGTPIKASYKAKYDGKPVPVVGAPWDTVAMKQVDANTTTFETSKTGGKYHATGKTVISKDGKTMTTTVTGVDNEGKPMTGTYIYDKQ